MLHQTARIPKLTTVLKTTKIRKRQKLEIDNMYKRQQILKQGRGTRKSNSQLANKISTIQVSRMNQSAKVRKKSNYYFETTVK